MMKKMRHLLLLLVSVLLFSCTGPDLNTDAGNLQDGNKPSVPFVPDVPAVPNIPDVPEPPASSEPEEIVVPDLAARVVTVSSPSMKIYFPATKQKRCRIVVACPGGGYSSIPGADGYEGAFYKDLFNAEGYALAVLYYRMPGGDRTRPISDITNAVTYLRTQADNLYIDPNMIGVMGFSAGGHLAATLATTGTGNTKANFQVLFYPVITLESGKTHNGSRNNFLGSNPSDALVNQYSLHKQVCADTPRTFLTYAEGDNVVPATYNGFAYYQALCDKKIPVTRYTYSGTRHGWHWGTVVFDGTTVNDGTKYENLDDIKSKLSTWLRTF